MANYLLGLPLEAVGRIAFLKSFLMDANNFRVGTCFNSFFRPSSMRGSL
jgi:hypothetical protein